MLDTNMGGTHSEQFAAEFEAIACGSARSAIARLRPNNNRRCLHAILSLPHRDDVHERGACHESARAEQWVEIGRRWLNEMGFDDNQYVMVRHTDTSHQHLHLVASRVRLDGEVVSDSHNYKPSVAHY